MTLMSSAYKINVGICYGDNITEFPPTPLFGANLMSPRDPDTSYGVDIELLQDRLHFTEDLPVSTDGCGAGVQQITYELVGPELMWLTCQFAGGDSTYTGGKFGSPEVDHSSKFVVVHSPIIADW